MMKLEFRFNGQYCYCKLTRKEIDIFAKSSSNYLSRDENSLLLNESFFYHSKAVDDKFRYKLCYKNSVWCLISNEEENAVGNFNDLPIDNKLEKLLVIMESPHVSEFTPEYEPIAPANGKTGQFFEKYFISHVLPILESFGLKLSKEIEYAVCFINPVPYQTSLAFIHEKGICKTLRNKVWKSLYQYCAIDFYQRITLYKPSIIVNACTSDLKSELSDVLRCFSVQKFEAPHPSHWERALASFRSA